MKLLIESLIGEVQLYDSAMTSQLKYLSDEFNESFDKLLQLSATMAVTYIRACRPIFL